MLFREPMFAILPGTQPVDVYPDFSIYDPEAVIFTFWIPYFGLSWLASLSYQWSSRSRDRSPPDSPPDGASLTYPEFIFIYHSILEVECRLGTVWIVYTIEGHLQTVKQHNLVCRGCVSVIITST